MIQVVNVGYGLRCSPDQQLDGGSTWALRVALPLSDLDGLVNGKERRCSVEVPSRP